MFFKTRAFSRHAHVARDHCANTGSFLLHRPEPKCRSVQWWSCRRQPIRGSILALCWSGDSMEDPLLFVASVCAGKSAAAVENPRQCFFFVNLTNCTVWGVPPSEVLNIQRWKRLRHLASNTKWNWLCCLFVCFISAVLNRGGARLSWGRRFPVGRARGPWRVLKRGKFSNEKAFRPIYLFTVRGLETKAQDNCLRKRGREKFKNHCWTRDNVRSSWGVRFAQLGITPR